MKDALARAADSLIESRLIGLVWLDDALNICNRKGHLVDWVALDVPMGEAIPPLHGMEEEMRALRARNPAPLSIPSIAFVVGAIQVSKISIDAFWEPKAQNFVLMFHRLGSSQALQQELQRQIDRQQAQGSSQIQAVIICDHLIENSATPMALIGPEGGYLNASRTWRETFDLSKDRTSGGRQMHLFAELRSGLEDVVALVLAGEEVQIFGKPGGVPGQDKDRRYDWQFCPVKDERERVVAFTVTATVSEPKKM